MSLRQLVRKFSGASALESRSVSERLLPTQSPFNNTTAPKTKKYARHASEQHHYILVKLLVLVRNKKGRTEKCGP